MNRLRSALFLALLCSSLLCLESCSGPSVFRSGGGTGGVGGVPPGGVTPPGGGSGGPNAQLTLTLTSAESALPTGITVLAFDMSVTGLTMISSTGSIVVFRSPATSQLIELSHLQADSVSMGSFPVLPGSFTSLVASFIPLTLTVFNQSGGTVAGNCLQNTVCVINPTTSGSITLTSTPFPLTLTGGQQTGLQITIDIGKLLKNDSNLTLDFSQPGILSATSLPLPAQPFGEFTSLDDQIGRVTNLDTSRRTFTFQSQRVTFDVFVDPTSTLFDGFDTCIIADITCLKENQSVSLDVGVKPDGTFTAHEIQLEDQVFDEEFEGVIFKVDSPTQFEAVITNVIPSSNSEFLTLAGAGVGTPVTVQLGLGTKFVVDTKGFTSGNLTTSVNFFQSASDTTQLLPGQHVEIRVKTADRAGVTRFPVVHTDRVRLRFAGVTGLVRAPVTPSLFNIIGLPPLFGVAVPIQVQTFTTGRRLTVFENVGSGLQDNDLVAMRALFFNNSAPPFFAAKVRKVQ